MEERCHMGRAHMWGLEVMHVRHELDSSLSVMTFASPDLAYGGFGFTSRLWGLALDAITSIDVVLANGTITTTSKRLNPDLFWVCTSEFLKVVILILLTCVLTSPLTNPTRTQPINFKITQHQHAIIRPCMGPVAPLASPPPSLCKPSPHPQPPPSFLTTGISLPPQPLKPSAPSNPLSSLRTFHPNSAPRFVFTRGDVQGNVSMGLAGGWCAPFEQLNATLQPFFDQMPPPQAVSFDTGDYLHSAVNLAGGSLDTMNAPDGTDTFYAKSLMTPEKQPMSDKALLGFMNSLANEGFTTPVVSCSTLPLYSRY